MQTKNLGNKFTVNDGTKTVFNGQEAYHNVLIPHDKVKADDTVDKTSYPSVSSTSIVEKRHNLTGLDFHTNLTHQT